MSLEKEPNDPDRKNVHPVAKLVLELGPLFLFFGVNSRAESIYARFPGLETWLGGWSEPILFATAVFIIAIIISLSVSLIVLGRLPIMPLVSGVVVIFFGALTLYLQDELFIKLKPTIVNVLFGGVLLGGLLFGRSLLGYVFDDAFKLTDEGWRVLTWRWGLFFLFLAVLNEAVWRTQTTDFWVAFKVWGVLPITMIFTMFQVPLLQRHALEKPDDEANA
jgi:intracellular septation protein